jgi:hypothetical protein
MTQIRPAKAQGFGVAGRVPDLHEQDEFLWLKLRIVIPQPTEVFDHGITILWIFNQLLESLFELRHCRTLLFAET